MDGDVIVQSGVDSPRAEPVGNCKNDEHPELIGKGKPEQCESRKEYAYNGHDTGTEFSCQFIGQKAGYDGSARYGHGNDPHKGYGNIQIGMYDRPARTEQRIGQSETDKGDINEGEQ